MPNIPKPDPYKPWKVVFGVHETIGFDFPALQQNVWKSGPKGPSFRTLWPPESEKGRPKKLKKNL